MLRGNVLIFPLIVFLFLISLTASFDIVPRNIVPHVVKYFAHKAIMKS